MLESEMEKMKNKFRGSEVNFDKTYGLQSLE